MSKLDYPGIFEPFEKLISIEILGRYFEVPENNLLLRCFQFLNLEAISMGEFCWNGDCANCQIRLASEGQEKTVLACRTKVESGMKIIKISKELELPDDVLESEFDLKR